MGHIVSQRSISRGKLSNTRSFAPSFFTKDSLKVRVADAWRLSDCDWWMTDGSRLMAVDRHPTAVPGWPGLRWSDLLLLAVMAAPPSPFLRCCQRDVFSCSRRRFGVSRSFPKLLLAAVRPAAIDCARPCNRSAAGCPTGGSARPPLHYAAQQTLPYAPTTALKVCWTLLPVGGGGGGGGWLGGGNASVPARPLCRRWLEIAGTIFGGKPHDAHLQMTSGSQGSFLSRIRPLPSPAGPCWLPRKGPSTGAREMGNTGSNCRCAFSLSFSLLKFINTAGGG